jgi:glycosyl transferase family 87
LEAKAWTPRRILAITGAAVLVLGIVWWLPSHARDPSPGDAQIYYRAAQHRAAGLPVYGDCPRERRDQPPCAFLYPPTALALLAPAALVSEDAFQAGFFALILLAFWTFAAALARIATGALSIESALATGALVQLAGVNAAMSLGNADIIVWALVAWAFVAPRAAGALLVLGAAIKIYPLALIVAWWPRLGRRFRAQVLIAAGVMVSSLFVVGWTHVRDWFTVCLPALSAGSFAWGNVSLVALALRPFVTDMAGTIPAWMGVVFWLAPILATGFVLYTQRHRDRQTLGAIVMVTAVWTVSICWTWRLALALLIPSALWLRKRATRKGLAPGVEARTRPERDAPAPTARPDTPGR